MRNRQGLARTISEITKRQVRVECGFGCVACGNPIVQYHHVTPYQQVSSHESSDIALLCPDHHDSVTQKRTGESTVRRWRSQPWALKKRRVQGDRLFYLEHPFELQIGDSRFRNFDAIVANVHGSQWFSLTEPEQGSNLVRLNFTLYNSDGSRALKIENNALECETDGLWDIRVVGSRLSIWQHQGNEVLQLEADPPNRLILKKLRMFVGAFGVTVENSGKATVFSPTGSVEMTGIHAGNRRAIFVIG